MVESIPAPDPHTLLPPLLACLPTSFASPQPPPALTPLLSPILRQRLQFGSYGGSNSDGWLPLLCWDKAKAAQLRDQIENTAFEPHPVSGEIEVGEVTSLQYKRLDEETLRARIILEEWPVIPIYLWCTGGEEGDSWKLAELLPRTEAAQGDQTWYASTAAADENAKKAERKAPTLAQEQSRPKSLPRGDEDDYWAQYDAEPSGTPARVDSSIPARAQSSEKDYYAQYGDVQPAMDGHDPDEEMGDAGESSLNGNILHHLLQKQKTPNDQQQRIMFPNPTETNHEPERKLSSPIPRSPSSLAGSDTVERMEERARRVSRSDIAVRQHISTTIKSMFRLAKSSGMDREEFENLVHRELETLSILDDVL